MKQQSGIDWSNLSNLYLEDELTITEIAELKECTPEGVRYAMQRRNILMRSESEALLLSFRKGRAKPLIGSQNPYYGKRHTKEIRQKISKALVGHRLTEEQKQLLSKKVSESFTEERRLRYRQMFSGSNHPMFGQPKSDKTRSKISDSLMGRFTGPDSPGWKGGIAYLPYSSDFNGKTKEEIRNRDNHICQLCGIPEDECLTKLPIHHIDYCKENGYKVNLISLCNMCNTKVNFNREHWQKYFTIKIRRIYGISTSVDTKTIRAI